MQADPPEKADVVPAPQMFAPGKLVFLKRISGAFTAMPLPSIARATVKMALISKPALVIHVVKLGD